MVGGLTGDALTVGSNNIAIGYQSLSTDTKGNLSVAMGQGTLLNQNFTTATNTYNTALGHAAGNQVTTGYYNTFVGGLCGDGTDDGFENVAVGVAALSSNCANANVAIGAYALEDSTANGVTAIGHSAAKNNISGNAFVAIGKDSLATATTAINNVAVGNDAMYAVTTGSYNIAVGVAALDVNTTGQENTAVGQAALGANTTAHANTAMGSGAMGSSTTASYNTAIGAAALAAQTTGTDNTAIGYAVLDANTTGYSNCGVGGGATYQASALGSLTTGYNNTGVGSGAMASISTAAFCTSIGRLSGYSATGSSSTFIGESAGYLMTSGNSNTILGRFNGNQYSLDIRTSDNYIVLSDGSGEPKAWQAAAGSFHQKNNSASWGTVSDRRIKENITDLESGLETITALRPVEFDYKIKDKQHDIGFIAQEYETVLPDQVHTDSSAASDIRELTDGEDVKVIAQNLVPYLVKAVQELSAKNDALEARIIALEKA